MHRWINDIWSPRRPGAFVPAARLFEMLHRRCRWEEGVYGGEFVKCVNNAWILGEVFVCGIVKQVGMLCCNDSMKNCCGQFYNYFMFLLC